MKTDDEIGDAKGLAYEEKVLLHVFRNSIGEVAMPIYKNMSAEDTIFAKINIQLIWCIYVWSVFFMVVVITNFLIAVISETYVKMSSLQI